MNGCVSGHHVYKVTRKPTLHEELQCRKEDDNPHDLYTVTVIPRCASVHVNMWQSLPLLITPTCMHIA